MQLKNLMLSAGLALVLVAPQLALAAERDQDFAMALAQQCEVDKSGMVTKASFLKMMEARWDKVAKGSKELSVANTAKIFMDSYRATN